jgi:hypothetical protein
VRSRLVTAALAGAAGAALLGGCGGGHDSTKSAAKLAKPIPPTCGVDNFRAPTITPAPGRPGGWELVYQFPAKPPRAPRPGETTVVDVLEEPPVTYRPHLKGGHEETVAGRQVSVVPGAGFKSSVVAWTTHTARYIIIANGNKPTTWQRILGCLP